AGGGEAEIVGLRARQHEVEFLLAQGCRQGPRVGSGISAVEGGVGQTHGPRRTQGQSLAQGVLHPFRAEREDDHLAVPVPGEAQGLLECIFVAFVDPVRQVLLLHPLPVGGDAQPGLGVGNLFQADGDPHEPSSLGISLDELDDLLAASGRQPGAILATRAATCASGPYTPAGAHVSFRATFMDMPMPSTFAAPLALQIPAAPPTSNPFLLFLESGWMGKFVFLVLVLLSLASWAVMI